MYRLFIPLVLFLVNSLFVSAQVRTTLDEQRLQGSVKSMVVRTYMLYEGNVKKLHKKITTEYNKEGFKTSETIYFDDDTTHGYKTNFKYDAEGHLTGKSGYSGNGSDNAVWVIKYSKHFREASIKEYDEKGKLVQEEVHLYDDRGFETEMVCYYDEVQQYKMDYEYDKAGNLITQNQKYIDNFDGTDHPDKIIYTYKEDGTTLVMKSDRFSATGADREISYEYGRYDKTFNWLQRTAKDRSKVHDITERQIEYY